MPWAVAVASVLSILDKESDIPLIQPGKLYYPEKEHACGWKCTGCKATNGPEVNRCIWCRTYKLDGVAPITQSTNSPLQFDMYTSTMASSHGWMEATKITPTEEPKSENSRPCLGSDRKRFKSFAL